MSKKSPLITNLERENVKVGTPVRVNVPAEMRASKFNGMTGQILSFACDHNPIPTIKLDNGIELAVELKHLDYFKQSSLF